MLQLFLFYQFHHGLKILEKNKGLICDFDQFTDLFDFFD
jgi:hypothetical protein